MFQHEIPVSQDVVNLIVPGELPVAAYATLRDSAIFTTKTKRLVIRDVRGLSLKNWGTAATVFGDYYLVVGDIWLHQ